MIHTDSDTIRATTTTTTAITDVITITSITTTTLPSQTTATLAWSLDELRRSRARGDKYPQMPTADTDLEVIGVNEGGV